MWLNRASKAGGVSWSGSRLWLVSVLLLGTLGGVQGLVNRGGHGKSEVPLEVLPGQESWGGE